MASALQRKDELPEGVYVPTVDYDMSIWMAYQNCINAPIFGRFSDSFVSCVRILSKMMLPEWVDQKTDIGQKYHEEIKGGQPIDFFGAITNLLHRRGFFDKPTKDMGHL